MLVECLLLTLYCYGMLVNRWPDIS